MKAYIKFLITIALMLLVINVEAQGLDDINFNDNVTDNNNTPVPINFLIPMAIAIGVALGIKRLK